MGRRAAIGLAMLGLSPCLVLACAGLSGLSGGETPPAIDAAIDGAVAEASRDGGAIDGATCSADLQNDAKNCGRCGRDCLGAACTSGACEPILLAQHLAVPNGIALGAKDIYYTTPDDQTVWVLPKAGGTPRPLATGERFVRGVALSGDTIFWGNGDPKFDDAGARGGIWKCVLPACTTKELVSAADQAAEPTLGGPFVYFGGDFGGQLLRAPVTGGDPVQVSNTSTFAIALDDTDVYHAAGGALTRTSIDAGAANEEVLLGGESTGGFVALDAAHVYWTFDDANGGHVIRLTKAAAAVNAITYGSASDNVNPVGIAVDDVYVYWSTEGTTSGPTQIPNGDGKVFACPKSGCPSSGPLVLATGNSSSGPMAVDDQAVYWIELGFIGDSAGRLRKVAKP